MPGIEIGQDALVAAGCTVTKNVEPYAVVMGNPGKPRGDVRTIKSKITGEPIYPWRHHFDHYMPWAESDFDTWYKSLDLEIRKEYKIDTLNGRFDIVLEELVYKHTCTSKEMTNAITCVILEPWETMAFLLRYRLLNTERSQHVLCIKIQ